MSQLIKVSQTELIKVVERVREEHLCSYLGVSGSRRAIGDGRCSAGHCDCKFGYLEGKGEAHGCAEMRVISDVLRAMTPYEFTRIVRRLGYAAPLLPDEERR